jgi:hypothetical protein
MNTQDEDAQAKYEKRITTKGHAHAVYGILITDDIADQIIAIAHDQYNDDVQLAMPSPKVRNLILRCSPTLI